MFISFQADFAKSQLKLFEADFACVHEKFSHTWKLTEIQFELMKYFCQEEERKLNHRSAYIYPSLIRWIGDWSVDINCIVEDIKKKLSQLFYVEMNQMVSDKFNYSDLRSLCTSCCLVCKFPKRGIFLFSPQKDVLCRTYEDLCMKFAEKKVESEYLSTLNSSDIHSSFMLEGKKRSSLHYTPTALNPPSKEETIEDSIIGSMRVKIYKKSILDTKVDAIVNAANKYLTNEAGVSHTICQAAGPEYLEECRQLLQKNGVPSLQPSKCYYSRSGRLQSKFRYILHAVGPRWMDFEKEEDCIHCLTSTVRKILETADVLLIASVAMPAIGSGKLTYQILFCTQRVHSVENYKSNIFWGFFVRYF